MVTAKSPEKEIYGEFFEIIEDFPLRNGITNTEIGDFGFNSQSFQEMEDQHLRLLETLEGSSLHRLIPMHGEELYFASDTKTKLNFYKGDILLSSNDIGKRMLASPTADCPILLLSTVAKNFAGIVHCSYHCLQKGVIPKVLDALKEIYSILNIRIGLFPGICGDCYKVGPEFKGGFFDKFLSADQKLDLEKVILHQCLDSGIEENNITVCDYCSAHEIHNGNFLFFSYRRNNTSQRNLVFTII